MRPISFELENAKGTLSVEGGKPRLYLRHGDVAPLHIVTNLPPSAVVAMSEWLEEVAASTCEQCEIVGPMELTSDDVRLCEGCMKDLQAQA